MRTTASVQPLFEVLASRQFSSWLAEQHVSLAFTTYQTGKLFLIGLQPDGRLSVFERTFNRCLGLWGDGQTLWMTSLYQLWRFENALEPGRSPMASTACMCRRWATSTGDLDIHDVAVDAERASGVRQHTVRLPGDDQRPAQLHPDMEAAVSCRSWRPRIAAISTAWRWKTVSPRVCHRVSQSDVADGWRERRRDGGCVIDVRTNEIIATWAVDAAFASRLSRSVVAARFRHGALRPGRPRNRHSLSH